MNDLIQKFMMFLELEKRYSKHTALSYKNDLTQFSQFIQLQYSISEVTQINHRFIRSWIVDLMHNQIKNKSINRKISTLRSFYAYLKRRGLIEKNPMLKIVAPKMEKRLPSYVQEDKIELLFDVIVDPDDYEENRNRLMIELLYSTGMRRSELIHLKDNDINMVKSMVKVLGKGNKERLIPISAQLLEKLKDFIRLRKFTFGSTTDFLFLTSKGKKLYPKLVYNIVKKYLSMITTSKKKSPHILRHSFATHLSNNGAELNAIKELLGHANLSATQIYTHNSIQKLKNVYQDAHPKAKNKK